MELDFYNRNNQTYWSDPEAGQFGAQAVSTNGYVSSYSPAPFGGVRYITPLPKSQVFYWTPPILPVKEQPRAIEPVPVIVKPEPVRSYLTYQVFAFIVTVFCNCIFGTIAWVLARKLRNELFLYGSSMVLLWFFYGSSVILLWFFYGSRNQMTSSPNCTIVISFISNQ
jgi:hypothetical protein